jgi:N-acetyl-anhydromuramyl-L-alanine amidase AmpD
MSFEPDYPEAIVYPAHSTNILRAINDPKVIVLHTPEEPVDDYESTPAYFAQPDRGASTHYYSDSDGDIFQMVPEINGAIANGVKGKPYPLPTSPAISLNYQSLSIEIEGYAIAMHRTMPRNGLQWLSVVDWIIDRAQAHSISIDREHIIGHYEVANDRTDPGTLNIDKLVEDAITISNLPEDDMAYPLLYVKKANQETWLINLYAHTRTKEGVTTASIKTSRDLELAPPGPNDVVGDDWLKQFRIV